MAELNNCEVKIEKIKAIRPHIIVTGTAEKPYYEILYYDIDGGEWHIGYSSYSLKNVMKWKEERFEIVDENEYVYDTNSVLDSIDEQPTADVVPVVRCKECKHRGESDCPMYHEELQDCDDGDYVYTDVVAIDNTDDDGFCYKGEREGGEV